MAIDPFRAFLSVFKDKYSLINKFYFQVTCPRSDTFPDMGRGNDLEYIESAAGVCGVREAPGKNRQAAFSIQGCWYIDSDAAEVCASPPRHANRLRHTQGRVKLLWRGAASPPKETLIKAWREAASGTKETTPIGADTLFKPIPKSQRWI
jgi:hypothetical protein